MCAAGYIVGTGGPRGAIAGVAAGNSARELLSSKSAGAQRRSSLFLEVRAAIAACGRRPLEIAANTQVIDFIGGHARNRTGVRRFAGRGGLNEINAVPTFPRFVHPLTAKENFGLSE
jgi:hypothetical protein